MNKKAQAFTIVELLIVIVVIAILAAISIIAYRGIQDRAAQTVLQSDLRNAAMQLGADKALLDTYPLTKAAANEGKGLVASQGTTLQYTSDGSAYCITATSDRTSVAAFHVANGGAIEEGVCSGHLASTDIAAPTSCPSGFIPVPGNLSFGTSGFCVMKYEAKNVGGVATSQAAGTPWTNISQTTAISTSQSACSGCHLITESEWMTIAANVLSVVSNWSGGSVGSGYIFRGHSDNNPANAVEASSSDNDGYYNTGNSVGSGTDQRRTLTLTNGEVIWDMAGNVREWTNATIAGGQHPGMVGDAAFGWKWWNDSMLQWNGFPSISRPSAISATVAGYSPTQGVGSLYTHYGTMSTHGFVRGGSWAHGTNAGVLSLALDSITSSSFSSGGFRVAK